MKKSLSTLCLFAYFHLINKEILAFLENKDKSIGIKKIIERQIQLPKDLNEEEKEIKSLNIIKNNISKIKKQYEDFHIHYGKIIY